MDVLRFMHRSMKDLGVEEEHLKFLRSFSTLGIVLGFSMTVSALVFPEYPSAVLELVFSGYSSYLDALAVSDRVFALLTGFAVLSTSAITHFLIDFYLGVFENLSSYPERARVRMVVLTSFFLSFVLARVAVVLSGIVGPKSSGMAGFLPVNEIWISGYHIHHFFFGFGALIAAGWLLLFREDFSRYYAGILYGAGLGIFIDEFGMLLTEGNYFATSSYFAAMTFLTLLLVGVYWDHLTYDE